MGQTIAEKLLSRHNLANEPVKAGDFMGARIDGAMCHYQFMDVHRLAVEAGFKEGFPRIWDTERFYLLVDHHQPALAQAYADENVLIRKEAKRLGVKYFHDAEPGIAHQMMPDYGYVRPGELVVGNDSHTIAYGALNAGSTGITRADMMHVLLFGELWFQVPQTVKIVLNGRQPNYPIAKDIILHLAGLYGDEFAQNMAIEFAGSLVPELSMDSRQCLSTHGVEVAAKFAIFPFDGRTREYLRTRTDKPYEPIAADADAVYQKEIVLDVDTMPFAVAKPHNFGNLQPGGRSERHQDRPGADRLVLQRPLRRHRNRGAHAEGPQGRERRALRDLAFVAARLPRVHESRSDSAARRVRRAGRDAGLRDLPAQGRIRVRGRSLHHGHDAQLQGPQRQPRRAALPRRSADGHRSRGRREDRQPEGGFR